MRVFISYRFTGETKEDLDALLYPVCDALQKKGIDVYCNYFDKDLPSRSQGFKPQDYVFDAFNTLKDCDALLVLMKGNEKSEGMILEVGYALSRGISVIVAKKQGVEGTYLPGMAKTVLDWNTIDELVESIERYNF